jgi:hypothetical protein
VYSEDLLSGASGGTAGATGLGGNAGATGGNGTGGSTTGGAGGSGGTGGSGGDGSGGTGGSGTSGSGGKGTGGGSGDGSGGTTGGAGGSGTTGGGAGTSVVDGGEGGDGGCPMGDCCPDDDAKVDPGLCGCGVADADTDNDSTPDCLDGCDDDPEKTSPGMCGCGVVEASCLPLKSSLIHRYSFNGTGLTVMDSIGTAHGTVMGTNATLDGTGMLTLSGGYIPGDMDPNKQYVSLPGGCLDGLTDATFDTWIDWAPPVDGTNARSYWQRIFDFGEDAGPGVGTYIFATPRGINADGPSRVSFTSSMGSSNQVATNGPTLTGGLAHITVVVDDTNDQLYIYVDGVLGSSVAFPGVLSAINDVSCYFGRSHYVADPYFSGKLDEIRIHSIAFTATDVAFSHASGPNPSFL